MSNQGANNWENGKTVSIHGGLVLHDYKKFSEMFSEFYSK